MINNFIGGEPPLGYRFGAFFLALGLIPNPLDIRFQKVSGLQQTIRTDNLDEGGQNLYTHRLPTKINYENLVLERGFLFGSLLTTEFNLTMSLFKFYTSNVIVTLFNESSIPISAWLFMRAYPVKWTVSDFNADQNELVVDHMELAFSRFQTIRI